MDLEVVSDVVRYNKPALMCLPQADGSHSTMRTFSVFWMSWILPTKVPRVELTILFPGVFDLLVTLLLIAVSGSYLYHVVLLVTILCHYYTFNSKVYTK